MQTTNINQYITEIPEELVSRISKVLNTDSETELKIESQTYSDLELFIFATAKKLHFNFRISNPSKYIKPSYIGLPEIIRQFEHPKITKFIYDLNLIYTTGSLSGEDFELEFHDWDKKQAIYSCHVYK